MRLRFFRKMISLLFLCFYSTQTFVHCPNIFYEPQPYPFFADGRIIEPKEQAKPKGESCMEVWKAAGKDLTLFPSARDNAPLVLLHTCGDEGESVERQVRAMTDADHAFAAIGGLRWEDEMSPWECPPIFRGEPPFTGGADAYLALLTQEILPGILSRLSAAPAYLALAGYSLAGLFAVYASYRTDLFSRIASASGSFWFPGFPEFAANHEPERTPDRVYFSLGDQEAKSRNRILRTVEDHTRALRERLERAGAKTVFARNPGNHFRDAPKRMAKGIAWILSA